MAGQSKSVVHSSFPMARQNKSVVHLFTFPMAGQSKSVVQFFSFPSREVRGGHNWCWDDHRWGTFAASHPGVIRVVARGGISVFNGSRSRYRQKKKSQVPSFFTVLLPVPTPSFWSVSTPSFWSVPTPVPWYFLYSFLPPSPPPPPPPARPLINCEIFYLDTVVQQHNKKRILATVGLISMFLSKLASTSMFLPKLASTSMFLLQLATSTFLLLQLASSTFLLLQLTSSTFLLLQLASST